MKTFYHLLGNNLLAGITNYTVWFAITYFTYLQTRSVFATSIISGLYLIATAGSGFWLGSLVDHHKKKTMMLLSSLVSLGAFSIGLAIYLFAGDTAFLSVSSVVLWIFIPVLMVGVIAGSIRNIALPTIIPILVPEDSRDKANGLSGTVSGIAFMVTSVISGLLVGHSGMLWVLILAIFLTIFSLIHLWSIQFEEKIHLSVDGQPKKVDIKGTYLIVKSIPGLLPLILFTMFNNFLGGVFMSLMDAYGLSLVSVQTWGLMWGFLSSAFIIGGLVIAKFGLGKNPLRAMFTANFVIWAVSSVFTIYPSIILLVMGMFIYLCVMPFIQAAEQTIIQKVVPKDKLGKVFGFAQSVEQSASPLTAFAIGPIAQFIFIPFMTTGAGVTLLGPWFGTGTDRGIALVFTLAGVIGLAVTYLAFKSKYYNVLSKRLVKA